MTIARTRARTSLRTFTVSVLATAVASLFAPPAAHAFGFGIEPLVGYTIQRRGNPDRTAKTLTYGARLVAGVSVLAAEAEYVRSNSTDEYTGYRVEELTERYRLGARTDIRVGYMSFFRFRAGAEARKITTDVTAAGASARNVSPTKVYPYVGAGVGVGISSNLKVVAEVTATLLDTDHWKNNDVQPSVGLMIGF